MGALFLLGDRTVLECCAVRKAKSCDIPKSYGHQIKIVKAFGLNPPEYAAKRTDSSTCWGILDCGRLGSGRIVPLTGGFGSLGGWLREDCSSGWRFWECEGLFSVPIVPVTGGFGTLGGSATGGLFQRVGDFGLWKAVHIAIWSRTRALRRPWREVPLAL